MLLTSILRLIFGVVSWAVLLGSAYLLWRWFDGTAATDEAGRQYILRDPWMLWLGLALGAHSLFGGWLWRFVLARGTDPVRPERGAGRMIPGTEGAELYLESAGRDAAPTLVFTHGAGMDNTIWYLAKRALGDRFHLVTWDLPGLGKSRSERISLELYADNLGVVVRSLDRPVVLVGHSMGGMTIQTLAIREPQLFGDKVVGVVLLNTTYTDPLKTMVLAPLATAIKPLLFVAFTLEVALLPLSWLSAWQSWLSGATHLVNRLTFGRGVTRTQLNHVALLGTRNSPASIAKGNMAMMKWDATGAAAHIPFPILIVAGNGDIVTKPSASADIASTAVEPHLERLDGANHMSFLDHADQYHAAIASYTEAAHARVQPRQTASS